MMKNCPELSASSRILIMMAVYNGAAYLEEQIESIRNQTYKNWELVAQDDGSVDGSVSIIKRYCMIDKRIIFYHNDTGFHGPYQNFHSLANRFKDSNRYDFYMFCDQDDIWYPEKIALFLSAVKDSDEIPALVYADFSLCDNYGKILEGSIDRIFGIADRTVYNVFLVHRVFGCNMLMNNKLFQIVPKIDISKQYLNIFSHDNVYTKFAAVLGKIVYLPTCTMLYRRHNNNVTETSSYRRTACYLLKRAFMLKKVARAHTEIYNHSLITIGMLRKLTLSREQLAVLNEVESVLRRGGMTALRYIRQHSIKWGRKSETFSRIFILVSGIYRQYIYSEDEINS